MKKALYIEAFSGISGNMLLGALIDLGADAAYIEAELKKMNLGEYELINTRADKCGINAAYFNVKIPGVTEAAEAEEAHLHEHHDGHHSHHHAHGCEGEEHHHHHHEEHHCCHQHDHTAEEAHEHHCCHAHEAGAHHHHEHRNFNDIKTIIENSDLSTNIKDKAVNVFRMLGLAEAKVHGKTLEEVHFHEVGAVDTIIDIVGSCLALENLGIEKIYVSEIKTGYGFVQCAHGLMPVPAPATAELLAHGLLYAKGNIERELATPTGAALMAALAEPSADMPKGFSAEKVGYGAGTRNLEIPNVLRATLGTVEEVKSYALTVAECNIDDMSGEVWPYVQEKLMAAGALDAWITPIIMKKGRPAQMLSVLMHPQDLPVLEKIILTETTTLGIRYYDVARHCSERSFIEATLPQGSVKVKFSQAGGQILNIAPEFEDCRKLAEASKMPLKKIMQMAAAAAEAQLEH